MPSLSQHVVTAVGRPTPRAANGSLLERLLHDMADGWQAGACPSAETLLARHPEAADVGDVVLRLVFEEVCLRRQHGQDVDINEVLDRYPRWRDELERLFEATQTTAARPPEYLLRPGMEAFGEFILLHELGRGAEGSVFLAAQPTLANRPVVLKVAGRGGEEHLSLARLQHTGIVPLHGVHEDLSRRALCMPYFGNATLQQLLEAVADVPHARRTGAADLVKALDQLLARVSVRLPLEGQGRSFLAGATYPNALAWVGAGLADALHYAHERGVVHLDLKPSNVLLAADGQPMLLDFHIAQPPLRAGVVPPGRFGGTPGYMSPEQRRACDDVQHQRPLSVAVDGRSDLYSLGLLLYEALGGPVPLAPDQPPPPLHAHNPHVSVGLSDIVHKCLAADPDDRYPDAAALALDLRRHLEDRPLLGVANRSVGERWRKWRQRRPFTLVAVLLLAGLSAALVLAAWFSAEHLNERRRLAEQALFTGQDQARQRHYADAVQVFKQGLELSREVSAGSRLTKALDEQLRLARRAQQAQELHVLADELRLRYLVDQPPPRLLQVLDAACQQTWEARPADGPADGLRLEVDLENALRTDLLDLAVCWADLRVKLADSSEAADRRRDALKLLAEAEDQFGGSAFLYHERLEHARALGEAELAAEAERQLAAAPVETAWDRYALGRSYLRRNRLEQARATLEQSLETEPHNFWANFCLGTCLARLGRHSEAVAAFSVCVGQSPQSPECFVRRARSHRALGQWDRAARDCSHALLLRPGLQDALNTRGVVYYHQDRLSEARDDLTRALAQGADPASAHYYLARIHLRNGERQAARSSLDQALQAQPHHKEARELRDRLGD